MPDLPKMTTQKECAAITTYTLTETDTTPRRKAICESTIKTDFCNNNITKKRLYFLANQLGKNHLNRLNITSRTCLQIIFNISFRNKVLVGSRLAAYHLPTEYPLQCNGTLNAAQ